MQTCVHFVDDAMVFGSTAIKYSRLRSDRRRYGMCPSLCTYKHTSSCMQTLRWHYVHATYMNPRDAVHVYKCHCAYKYVT